MLLLLLLLLPPPELISTMVAGHGVALPRAGHLRYADRADADRADVTDTPGDLTPV